MTDHIEIRALRILCHVGVGDDERAHAQPLELDIDLEADLSAAATSDDVADTIDYGEVSLSVAAAVQATEHALLERAAAVAADAALAVDHRATAVTVSVRKLRPPIPLDVGSTAVRIRRSADRPS